MVDSHAVVQGRILQRRKRMTNEDKRSVFMARFVTTVIVGANANCDVFPFGTIAIGYGLNEA
jgi:hypothetical protein